ncbi:hypothetical protein SLEP1_g60378 [Rubroshorea leprosula]|uniref:Uncharacterized protein n=1 Tax=Rubroshorea leprosula TaxID=152421 RepID=A0AAV5MV40_9ROSI|nr:hypothetical protein SLEP1_g60378 [Rubroshorea leprosula]
MEVTYCWGVLVMWVGELAVEMMWRLSRMPPMSDEENPFGSTYFTCKRLRATSCLILSSDFEPKSEARQMSCTRETGPTSAQGSELIQITSDNPNSDQIFQN